MLEMKMSVHNKTYCVKAIVHLEKKYSSLISYSSKLTRISHHFATSLERGESWLINGVWHAHGEFFLEKPTNPETVQCQLNFGLETAFLSALVASISNYQNRGLVYSYLMYNR